MNKKEEKEKWFKVRFKKGNIRVLTESEIKDNEHIEEVIRELTDKEKQDIRVNYKTSYH